MRFFMSKTKSQKSNTAVLSEAVDTLAQIFVSILDNKRTPTRNIIKVKKNNYDKTNT